MKLLYIHIGTPKTGTTTIQQFLKHNSDILLKKGIYYPEFPKELDNSWILPINCSGNDSTEGNVGWLPRSKCSAAQIKDILYEKFNKAEIVLLSSECIWGEEKNKFKFLKNLISPDVQVKVIVYLRKQIDFLESQYRECIRVLEMTADVPTACNPEAHILDDIIDNLDYYNVLESMAKAVGRKNIIVRPYERSQLKNSNLLADFLGIFGLELTSEFEVVRNNYNPAMDNAALIVKQNMNKTYKQNRAFMYNCFYEALKRDGSVLNPVSGKTHTRSLIPYRERCALMERYVECNQKVAIEYLHRPDGKLFYEEISDEAEETVSTRAVLEKTITIFTSTLMNAYEDRQRLYKRIENLEKWMYERETKFIHLLVREKIKALNNIMNDGEKLNVIIYGIGRVADILIDVLQEVYPDIIILACAVTKKLDDREFKNIQVMQIDELSQLNNSALVITGTEEPAYQKEMNETLQSLGFSYILNLV